MRGITGILLAAGSSRRFGANKLLAPLADGTPMVLASAHCLRAVLGEVIAVVQSGDRVIPAMLAAEGLHVVTCKNAHTGMGASLAAGVAASRDAHGWLIGLADMPFIQSSTLQRVAQSLKTGAPLAVPFHAGRRGHPVGFSAAYRDELLALSGDAGARAILARAAAALVRLDVNDPGILFDVDTPSDLAAEIDSRMADRVSY